MGKNYEASIFKNPSPKSKHTNDDKIHKKLEQLMKSEPQNIKNVDNITDFLNIDGSDKSSDCNSENENFPTGYTEYDYSKMDNVGIAKIVINNVDLMVVEKQLYNYNVEYGRWEFISQPEAEEFIRNILIVNMPFLGNKITSGNIKEIYKNIMVLVPIMPDNIFERGTDFLNFKDVAINWKTREKITKRKELYFRYSLNVSYLDMPKESKGYYRKYKESVFGKHEKLLAEYKKFLGLAISDIRTLKYCFFFHGPSNTGKTVCLNLITHIVGEDMTSSISFNQVESEFAITQLVGKRLNVSGEMSGVSNKRLDIFKSLTGNDKITACYKGKNHFEFKNKCLLVFACNNFPTVKKIEELDSFLSRTVFFPFTNVIDRSEWIENLDEKMMEDIAEIIKDAIEGLRLLEKDDFKFNETTSMLACKKEFQGMYDSFSIFAEDHIEFDPDSHELSEDIYCEYKNFCTEETLIPLAQNVWPQILKQKYPCKPHTFKLEDGSSARGYKGIRLKPYSDNTFDE